MSRASSHSAFVFYPCISVPLPFIFILLPPPPRPPPPLPSSSAPTSYLSSARPSPEQLAQSLTFPPPSFSHIYSSPHSSLLRARCQCGWQQCRPLMSVNESRQQTLRRANENQTDNQLSGACLEECRNERKTTAKAARLHEEAR